MKPEILEENLQPLLYWSRIIPNYTLNVVLIPQKRNFSLQQIETITENCNQSKGRVVETRTKIHVGSTTPTPKAQGTCQKRRQKKSESQINRKFVMRSCLPVTSETMPVKSHQHHCLSTRGTRTTTYMITRTEESPEASTLLKELQATKVCWEWET